MMLAFALAALTFATLLAVALPLLRGGRSQGGVARFDRAVYRDQLRELERDAARGLITGAEAAATRLEIQRRLLATDAIADRAPNLARSPVLATLLTVVVACGSIGIYLTIGTPEAPDVPFASRTDTKIADTAARLAERLRAEPSNKDMWLLYARATSALNDWNTSAGAYKRAIDLGARAPDVLAGYAEMLVMQNRGVVTPVARETFEALLRDDPRATMARYYLALEAEQAGDSQKAIALLQAVLEDLPRDAPARAEVVRRLTDIAKRAGLPPPTPATGPENTAMVEAMVNRLAERLQQQPDDLDGWLRLGRARSVQGHPDQAAGAYERAAALKPEDVKIKLMAIDALFAGRAVSDPVPPRAIALLRQVEAVAPDEPTALWYLGIAAARDGQAEKARGYWTRLLPNLDPDGEEAKLVRGAIDAIEAK